MIEEEVQNIFWGKGIVFPFWLNASVKLKDQKNCVWTENEQQIVNKQLWNAKYFTLNNEWKYSFASEDT